MIPNRQTIPIVPRAAKEICKKGCRVVRIFVMKRASSETDSIIQIKNRALCQSRVNKKVSSSPVPKKASVYILSHYTSVVQLNYRSRIDFKTL